MFEKVPDPTDLRGLQHRARQGLALVFGPPAGTCGWAESMWGDFLADDED